ncbi:hypothetical protein DPMN_037723 [Dreissena polymorpha]|uniref:Uncharacterized protein n=1 Tax=Dreissena polymorpha TaxID=45954 RepID=A0A9D4MD92_DREPO|nr:hypothetical protein DPMN_037723 [Dreissena polymorpha]
MLLGQEFCWSSNIYILLEQQIDARAASRCCSSSYLLLEQNLNAGRAGFFCRRRS